MGENKQQTNENDLVSYKQGKWRIIAAKKEKRKGEKIETSVVGRHKCLKINYSAVRGNLIKVRYFI